ncbi:NADP-dependent oxidoreductase domain-containing protein [Hygrophoropsis aurantiaca]|uniref:NADP-dependent oxidoreductase domain-containing protein n=1 Tax=Hygrophoropsis aurantiaca TaxID=72124 RepID=A0ACB8AJ89_9AGAM|nr:NADP-dependent oxidoreductase domain-containing protein [Hygrophoropsis aurantiaca]
MSMLSPKMIYGTAWKGARTTSLVVSAFLQGFRAVDTACQPKHYRESLVGDALEILRDKHNIRREQIFVQTKYTPISGQDLSQPVPYNPVDPVPKQILSSFQASLANLRVSYLDSYLLHSPLRTPKQTLEAWRTLIALQDEGKVHQIGLSNVYDVDLLKTLSAERPVQVVQNRWYEGNLWDRDVCKYCRENSIQYQSFWTLSGSPQLLTHPSVLSLSHALDCTPPQVLFKLAQLHNITPLTGTTDELHMQQDLIAERIVFKGEVQSEVKNVTQYIWG